MSTLKRNVLWQGAGNATYGCCQWLLIVIIARLGNPDMVGQFALASALTFPVVLLFGMQLRILQVTDQRQQFTFGDYLSHRLVSAAAGLITIWLIVAVMSYRSGATTIIVLLGTARTSELISDIFQGLSQQREQMQRVGVSLMLRALLSTAVMSAVLYTTRSVGWAMAAYAGACVFVLLTYDRKTPAVLHLAAPERRPQTQAFWKLSCLATPLAIGVLLSSLNAYLPRYFIYSLSGNQALGRFSVLGSVNAAGLLFVSALGQASMPRLVQRFEARDRRGFGKVLIAILAAVVVACVAGLCIVYYAGDPIVALVYGSAYTNQGKTLLILTAAASMSFCSAVLGYAVKAVRELTGQAIVQALVTVTTAALCYLLVPRYGGAGAALAMLGSSTLSVLLLAAICQKHLVIRTSLDADLGLYQTREEGLS
jgi:O-antigen/teichoic acid export membrane protein